MASYLATASIGEFDVKSYEADGIKYWDAIDPDLLTRPAPRTGSRFALSSVAQPSYKRLQRTIDVPATAAGCRSGSRATPSSTGTSSSSRPTPSASTTGRRCPTSMATPARTPASRARSGFSCTRSSTHYQRENADGGCDPRARRASGTRSAARATATSNGSSTCRPYAGKHDRAVAQLRQRRRLQLLRRLRRRHRRSRRRRLDVVRERRQHARRLDGAGAPRGQRAEREQLAVGTAADAPDRPARSRAATLARQPEIIRFLAGLFGPYPFSSAGGDRRRPAGARVRAREPDAAGLLARLLRGPHRPDGLGRRPRARAPVDGRLARPGRLAAHLAQRGLRHLLRMAVERARGSRDGAGELRLLRVDPGRRPVLGATIGDPGPDTCSTAPSTTAAR